MEEAGEADAKGVGVGVAGTRAVAEPILQLQFVLQGKRI